MATLHILDFISSLPRRLSSSDVAEDLRTTKKELAEGVLPFFENFGEFFTKNQLRSKFSLNLMTSFNSNYSGEKARLGKTPIPSIALALKNVSKNLDFVMKEQANLLEQDILQDGLTAKKSILLRAGAQISSLAKYAQDFATYILDKETREANPETLADCKMTPYKENLVIRLMPAFASLLSAYGKEPSAFKKDLENVPDVVVNSQTAAALAGVYREVKLDPFSVSQVAQFDSNPIYHLRLFFAEWQANRYKAYKDKKKMLELRLLNLQQIQENTPKPALEKEIIYLQDRVDGYEAKMKRMEESVE